MRRLVFAAVVGIVVTACGSSCAVDETHAIGGDACARAIVRRCDTSQTRT